MIKPSKERVTFFEKHLSTECVQLMPSITDRGLWKNAIEGGYYSDVLEIAQTILNSPTATISRKQYEMVYETGERSPWSAAFDNVLGNLKYLVLAECTENKSAYIPKIEEYLDTICTLPMWVDPAHDNRETFLGKRTWLDLSASAIAWELAMTLSVLDNKLSERIRRKVLNTYEERIFGPYEQAFEQREIPKNVWFLGATMNWNPVCLSGITGAALMLIESKERRAWYAAAAEIYLPNYLKGFTPDGYCSEGISYWNYGFSHFLFCTEIIAVATEGKCDLTKTMMPEKLSAVVQYPAKLVITNDIYPSFADMKFGLKPSACVLNMCNVKFPESCSYAIDTAEFQNAQNEKLYRQAFYMFRFGLENSIGAQNIAKLNYRIRDFFDSAGVLVCRPLKSQDKALAVAVKAGHCYENHNHHDVGSFMVVCGESPLLVDPGKESYTLESFGAFRYENPVNNSYGHSVPMVGGKPVKANFAHLLGMGEIEKPAGYGQVIYSDFTDGKDSIIIDLTKVYNVETPQIQSLRRTFVYSRTGKTSITIIDSLKSAKETFFESALISFSPVEIDSSHNKIIIAEGTDTCIISINTNQVAYSITSEQVEANYSMAYKPYKGRKAKRIAVRLKDKVLNSVIEFSIKNGIL